MKGYAPGYAPVFFRVGCKSANMERERDVAGQDRLASRGNEPKQKKNSRRRKQLQAVQVGQRMELSDQGREYDQKVWGNLARGGQGSVTQVNPEQDVCWVMWDATRQTGDT